MPFKDNALRCLILVIILLPFAILGAYRFTKYAYMIDNRNRILNYTAECVAKFIIDNKRMPLSKDELEDKGYVKQTKLGFYAIKISDGGFDISDLSSKEKLQNAYFQFDPTVLKNMIPIRYGTALDKIKLHNGTLVDIDSKKEIYLVGAEKVFVDYPGYNCFEYKPKELREISLELYNLLLDCQ